ncbi:sensor histidine kinase [Streptomyces sp. NPDC085927]|uniref:sensor histidine kinase n=1 Tax=Streptomyces sp. NPDC085927 TaxID=3365738 RepID=UPI0037D50999
MRRSLEPGPSPSHLHRPTSDNNRAPRIAVTITWVVICGFSAVALTQLLQADPSTPDLVLSLALLSLLTGIQLCHSLPLLMPRIARYRKWSFGAQVALTYLPLLLFSTAWLGMPGFLAGTSLLLLKPVVCWMVFIFVIMSVAFLQFTMGYGSGDLAHSMLSTCLTGLVVHALSRMSSLVQEVQATREELTHMAVMQERLRFARDLHDLLGYSLSAITLKCELTHRLVRQQPERAEEEITEILRTARQALSDVRSVASSHLSMSLLQQLAAAESILRDIDIHTEMRVAVDPPAGSVDTVLATVIREGVTNVLRHSKPQHCVIEAVTESGEIRVTVLNDGADAESPDVTAGEPDKGGNGLRNLTTRMESLGGRLVSGPRADGWFELTATVPQHDPGR